MTIDEQIKILESNAEFERKGGDLQGCLNFSQLAEWLKDYKRLLEQQDDAIKYFDTINKLSKTCGMSYSSVENKVKRAAKALKELQQEPCEDAISRQAAIRLAEQGQIQGYEWQFKELNKLPPVTPQQKIGHWISNAEDDLKISDYTCSNCKGLSDEDSAFCSKCGAKMQEVRE